MPNTDLEAISRRSAWHQSNLSTLLDGCAKQYELAYIDGLSTDETPALAVGTSFHAGVEAHERARHAWWASNGKRGSEVGIDLELANRYANETFELLNQRIPARHWTGRWEEGPDTALQAISDALEHWYLSPIPEGQPGAGGTIRERLLGWRPVGIERYAKTWFGGGSVRPVAGTLDALYLDSEGRYRIVDHKTASSFRSWPAGTDVAHHRTQATWYALLTHVAPGFAVKELPVVEFQVVRTDESDNVRFEPVRVVTVEPDTLDVLDLYNRLDKGDRMLAEGVFPPNTDWFLCDPRWCSFYGGECEATREG